MSDTAKSERRESVRTDDPELVAETKISRIMRDLSPNTEPAVIAWFYRKYPKPTEE